jgi:hypothetical protein
VCARLCVRASAPGQGITSENVAEAHGVDRAAQDAFSALSHERAARAQAAGKFDAEIVPVTTKVTTEEGTWGRPVGRPWGVADPPPTFSVVTLDRPASEPLPCVLPVRQRRDSPLPIPCLRYPLLRVVGAPSPFWAGVGWFPTCTLLCRLWGRLAGTKTVTVTKDDGVRGDTTAAGLAKLRPAFKPDGTTTAGNSSQARVGGGRGGGRDVLFCAARACFPGTP